MVKENIIYDENAACACKACKRKHRINYPKIVEISGLFYAQCKCDRYSPYDFLGVTKKHAIKNWNDYMLSSAGLSDED